MAKNRSTGKGGKSVSSILKSITKAKGRRDETAPL